MLTQSPELRVWHHRYARSRPCSAHEHRCRMSGRACGRMLPDIGPMPITSGHWQLAIAGTERSPPGACTRQPWSTRCLIGFASATCGPTVAGITADSTRMSRLRTMKNRCLPTAGSGLTPPAGLPNAGKSCTRGVAAKLARHQTHRVLHRRVGHCPCCSGVRLGLERGRSRYVAPTPWILGPH